MHFLLTLIVCVSTFSYFPFAYSEEEYSQEAYSAFEGDPFGIIKNSVDVISGSYREYDEDLVTSSCTPLTMKRSYTSSRGAWSFFPECLLTIGKNERLARNQLLAICPEANGTRIIYTAEKNDTSIFKPNFTLFNKGVVNTAKGACGAATHLKNNFLKSIANGYELTTCTGALRVYEKSPTSNLGILCTSPTDELSEAIFYRLVLETLPSGNKLQYRYDNAGKLSSIHSVNDLESKEFSSLHFVYDTNQITVQASDGQSVLYRFSQNMLIQVKSSSKPEISYHYRQIGVKAKALLAKKELPEGRFLAIDYNASYKVKTLHIPQSDQPLYIFNYHNGHTDVIDALNAKTRYCHKDQKLVSIERYDGDLLYSKEKLIWEAKDTGNNLSIRSMQDSKGAVLSALLYSYDPKGNVVSEKNIHNVTEDVYPQAALSLVGSSDRISNDRFHNLLKKTDLAQIEIECSYKPNTNLLIQKLIRNRDKIEKRYFYFYNEDAILVREVVDNGKTSDYEDINKVTERHILEIQPRSSTSTTSEEIIEEKYYDTVTKQEKLKQRTRHQYNSRGQLIKKELYDCMGAFAKKEEYTFDAHNNLISFINPLGEKSLFSYDANDNCIQITECANGRTTSYSYDQNNRLLLTKEAYLDGSTIITSSLYDALGNVTTQIDQYGNRTSYTYDFLSRITQITLPTVFDENGSPIQPTYCFGYDVLGNTTSKTDPKGYKETALYAGLGKPVFVQYPDDTKNLFHWNDNGTLKRKCDREKLLSFYEYDSANKRTSSYLYKRDSVGETGDRMSECFGSFSAFHCLESKNEKDAYTLFGYDSEGKLISEIQPTKRRSSDEDLNSQRNDYDYDSLGRPIRIKRWIDKKNYITQVMRYDLLDRVIESWVEEQDGTRSFQQNVFYDGFGNISKKVTPGFSEEIHYLQGRRPHIITHSNGTTVRIEYRENKLNTLGQYYLEKVSTDSAGVSVTTSYDALARKVSSTQHDPLGSLLTKQELRYDAAGNLAVTIESILPTPEDGSQEIKVERVYGPMNRLEILKEAAGTKDERLTKYTYDECGKLASISSPGKTIYYSHNKEPAEGQQTTYEKDAGGKEALLCKTTTNTYGTKLIQDSVNSTVKTSRTIRTDGLIESESITDEYGWYSISYAYDRLGRITQLQLPDYSTIEYQYKGLALSKVIRNDSNKKELYSHQFLEYNADGTIALEQLAANTGLKKTTYEKGYLASFETDFFNERITVRDLTGAPTQFSRNANTTEFAYDSLGKLSKETFQDPITYTHNSIGNLVQKNDTPYSYNNLNQLLHDGSFRYSYDTDGNLKTVISGTEEMQLSYTNCHQLQSVTKNGKTVASYTWDACGRRQGSYDPEKKQIRRALFVGSTIIGTIDERDRVIELQIPQVISGSEAHGAIAIELKNKIYVPIFDLLGNIACLVDSTTKKVVESYQYSAFGEERIFNEQGIEQTSSQVGNPWRYRNLRKDDHTGFITMGYRDYDPHTHRFITRDPLGYFDGPNLYAYAHNNPLRYSDPDGLLGRYVEPCHCHPQDCGGRTPGGKCGHGGTLVDDSGDTKFPHCASYEPSHRIVTAWNGFEDRLNNKSGHLEPVGSFHLPSGSLIEFVNGINTTAKEAQECAQYISAIGGGIKVGITYNATHGCFRDLTECFDAAKLHMATTPAILLQKKWEHFYNTAPAKAMLLQFCHSQGAIHAKNALRLCDEDVQQRVIIVTISPGTIIGDDICHKADNYINMLDVIPFMDPALDLFQDTHPESEPSRPYGTAIGDMVRNWKNIHFVMPRSLVFHGFINPTFTPTIKEHLKKFKNQYGD